MLPDVVMFRWIDSRCLEEESKERVQHGSPPKCHLAESNPDKACRRADAQNKSLNLLKPRFESSFLVAESVFIFRSLVNIQRHIPGFLNLNESEQFPCLYV